MVDGPVVVVAHHHHLRRMRSCPFREDIDNDAATNEDCYGRLLFHYYYDPTKIECRLDLLLLLFPCEASPVLDTGGHDARDESSIRGVVTYHAHMKLLLLLLLVPKKDLLREVDIAAAAAVV